MFTTTEPGMNPWLDACCDMIEMCGLEVCNKQPYAHGKETFYVDRQDGPHYVNTLDYIMGYTMDMQCVTFCVDEYNLLRINSDHFPLYSVWDYMPLMDYVDWMAQRGKPLELADWEMFKYTGIEECSRYDVTEIENEENRIKLVYRKILDILSESADRGLGKSEGIGKIKKELVTCIKLRTCLSICKKTAICRGHTPHQIVQLRQINWEIHQNIQMEVRAKSQMENENFAESLHKANDQGMLKLFDYVKKYTNN